MSDRDPEASAPWPGFEPATEIIQKPNTSCLFRSLSFFLVFCTLIFVLIQLPISDTPKVLLVIVLLITGLLTVILTTPRQTIQAAPATEQLEADPEEPAAAEYHSEDHIPLDYFEQLVQEAIGTIPPEFQRYMHNLAIIIESEPDLETRQSVGLAPGHTLLGLYQGTPLTSLGHGYSGLPERITIYQKPIEQHSHGNPDRIRQQVRATVLHELAHHFGIDHHDMPHWLK